MNKNRTAIELIRTIVWFDVVSNALGLKASGLDDLYLIERERLGIVAAGVESDNRMKVYRDGISRPSPEFSEGLAPGVLEFFAQRVKGSERWFFHPLFNLLDGQISSSEKVVNRILENLPKPNDLFPDAFEDIRTVKPMKSRAQRNLPELPMVLMTEHSFVLEAPMTNIRNEMLRLDHEVIAVLFESHGGRIYRRQRHADEEAGELALEVSLDRLTAAVGLALEAQLLGWRNRFPAINKLLELQLAALSQHPCLERVSEKLHKIISRAFKHGVAVSYSREDAEVFGYPESWETWVRSNY